MKALVIGLGSMGRRRVRLLNGIDSVTQVIGVDTQSDRRRNATLELGIQTYENIEDACVYNTDINIAFVSTSPLSHSNIIRDCLNRSFHTFTEINLVGDGYDENMKLAAHKGVVLFLSSTFLYRREVEYVKKAINDSKSSVSYIYHVGQYLPDWHPWEDYRSYFVGDKRTNGCRELMAIEFPWLFNTFGMPIKWISQKKKLTGLNIDYPDTFQVLFEHENGNTGVVQIDLVSRKPSRDFKCVSENLYISWNGTPDGLYRYDYDNAIDQHVCLYESIDKNDKYIPSIVEDAYNEEIMEFIGSIEGRKTPRYSFEDDKAILSIIDNIEDLRA